MRWIIRTRSAAVFLMFVSVCCLAVAGDVNYYGVNQSAFGPVNFADLLNASGVSFVPPVSTVTVVAPTTNAILNGGPVGAVNPGYDPISALMAQMSPTTAPSNPYSNPFADLGLVGSVASPPSVGPSSPLSGGLDFLSLLGATQTTSWSGLLVAPLLVNSPVIVTPSVPTSSFNPVLSAENPEPSTWVLMLAGLGSVYFLRRRLVAR